MTTQLFSELGLSPEVLKAVDKLGFEKASPVQASSIPLLLAGSDLVGQSQTGSGKTAAFAIPAIEKSDPQKKVVQVLILCPTRELAVQVSEEVSKLALFKRGLQALPIYGGQSYERQFFGLREGAQIVIGTPGRVMDHLRRGTLRLETLRMVVLDEADVMLDMGFREDIERILESVPATRQTVFFSATMPRPIRELIEKFARNPATVNIEQTARTVPTVEQVYYEVDRRFKIELLTRLIDIHDYKLGIIFCNTKRMVDDLVDHLNAQGYSADRLHGDMNQTMRDRVMNKFRKSGLEFLVATDVAARGIDVDDVQVVVNYDLPYDPEDYLHRVGRTGRAGRSGRAISFVAGRELFQVQQIERFTRTRMQRLKIPSRDEVEHARAAVFLARLRGVLSGGEFPRQDHLIETLLEEGFTSTDIASALIHLLHANEGAAQERPTSEAPPERERREYPRSRGEGDSGRFSDTRPERGRPQRERSEQGAPWHRPGPPQSRPPRRPDRPLPASKAPANPPQDRPIPSTATSTIAPAVKAPAPPPATSPRQATDGPAFKPKPSRRTPSDRTRIFMNVGSEMGVIPSDVVSVVMGETGLPAEVVGTVDIRERHLFVDVSSEHVQGILAKLNRSKIKGNKVKVKMA